MQVSIEEIGGLKRQVTVEYPAERVENEIESRLQSLAREARIDGFRPGKVPVKVVRERFGDRVRTEVLGDLMRAGVQEALTMHNLRPVVEPVLEPLPAETSDGFRFRATFDVLPQIEIRSVETIKVERPLVEVTEADVDTMLETLRSQRAQFTPAQRPAAKGDRILARYTGQIEGRPLENPPQEDVPIDLGASGMLPGFEDGLIGASAGDRRSLDLTLPEGHPEAGKSIHFDVEVRQVLDRQLPPLDAELVRAFGVPDGDLAVFRAEVRRNMQRELEQKVADRLKQQVMEGILELHPMDVPDSMVEREVRLIRSQLGASDQAAAIPDEFLAGQSRRRVVLGLVLTELVKVNGIRLNPERVRAAIERMAEAYENPQEVISWHYRNPEEMHRVETVVMEDEVVDWVMARANVSDRAMSFSELMKPGAGTNSA